MSEQKGGSSHRLLQAQTGPLGSSTAVMDQRVSRWTDDLHIEGLSRNLSEKRSQVLGRWEKPLTSGVRLWKSFLSLETTCLG